MRCSVKYSLLCCCLLTEERRVAEGRDSGPKYSSLLERSHRWVAADCPVTAYYEILVTVIVDT